MSTFTDSDIERQEIIKEAGEMGYTAKDMKQLREMMVDVAGSWNGEDDRCMGSGWAGVDTVTEEDAGAAQELIERIDALKI